jgi:hypothetical protein
MEAIITSLTIPAFSLFLQREGAEDILDFWLDVQQHENLCRAYFKDVRKSGRTIREDWPEYWDYARRRGSIYGTVVGMAAGPAGAGKRSTASTTELLSAADAEKRAAAARSPSPDPRLQSTTPHGGATAVGSDFEPARSTTPFSFSGRTPTFFHRRVSRTPTVLPRAGAITKEQLTKSAEYIYLRYLSPAGSTPEESHEIYLPPALRVHSFNPDEPGALAQIPDMFHAQKEYCFRAMEQDAFPRFLRAKAFGNLTPVSSLVRLIAGLICLWIALATAFALVFLDVKPKSKRFFVSSDICWFPYLVANQLPVAPVVYTLHLRFPLSHLSPIRTGSNPRFPQPLRIYPLPHTRDSRAIRQEATPWPCRLGYRPRRHLRHRAYPHLLGCAWPPALTVHLFFQPLSYYLLYRLRQCHVRVGNGMDPSGVYIILSRGTQTIL